MFQKEVEHLPSCVNDCSVLNIGERANFDVVQISSENTAIPYAGLQKSWQSETCNQNAIKD